MRKFLQNKLWRDLGVTRLQSQGSVVYWRRLDDEEFVARLKEKLVEEAHEVMRAKGREHLIEEIADVLEVIDALREASMLSYHEISAVQTAKRDRLGGFRSRCFVESAEHPHGSEAEQYCLTEPDKYPEID